MDATNDTVAPDEDRGAPHPLSRAERQQQTRLALIDAGRRTFTEHGYHGANLAQIAKAAGYSKGAVYSNFANKAELFLAVMDANLEMLSDRTWDPFAPLDHVDQPASEEAALIRGFALATLEFIASAAREPELSTRLSERVQVLLDAFGRVADASSPDDEPLEREQVAALLAALDQGFALLALSGSTAIDGNLLRYGMRRLLDPARAGEQPPPPAPPPAGPSDLPIHDRDVQRRMLGMDERD